MKSQIDRKLEARRFVERWEKEAGREEAQSNYFWEELFAVLGIENPTHKLECQHYVRGRKTDLYYPEHKVLIENKSRSVSLDKPRNNKQYGLENAFQQAMWYYNNEGTLRKPYWIITCNFDEIRIYDMRERVPYESEYAKVLLHELPDKLHYFDFLLDETTSVSFQEAEISVKAADLVGKLYSELEGQYPDIETDREMQQALNVLIVRLVFLLYAEDAGLFDTHLAFNKYMRQFKPEHFHARLEELFDVLDTPESERRQNLPADLRKFCYINGGLFSKKIYIPEFTKRAVHLLLTEVSAGFNWKNINPTIFGATFESTLNPETRRSGGMHYTSKENIHKVIDPLFLDDLKDELAEIEAITTVKTRNLSLIQFKRKLASLVFLDPACGSGNFLTETYLCLRKLENLALIDLLKEDEDSGRSLYLGNESWQFGIKVSISQFYGIEINDFAVAVAKTALWIAEAQAKAETEELFGADLDILPLANNDNIIVANALRMDWNDLVPNTELSYIIGNPPFCGKKERSDAQNEDMDLCYGKNCDRTLDYVTCWFRYATEYMKGTDVRTALVSTKSVTQGEQIYIWDRLLKDGARISFAWRPFMWGSDSLSPANVVCVIIGFSVLNKRERERESAHLHRYAQRWSHGRECQPHQPLLRGISSDRYRRAEKADKQRCA